MNSDNTEDNGLRRPITVAGCGILHKEMRYLIKKNGWPLSLKLSDSSLHINFDKLRNTLENHLEKARGKSTMVFYGTCHPLMEKILANHNTIRTPGQNCVEILLGKENFTREIQNGAFFLMEDWARRFGYVTGLVFKDKAVTRMIFQMEHKYLLGIRTCCSKDFTQDAEEVAELVGLPIKWMDVSLDHMEKTLEMTIERRIHLP